MAGASTRTDNRYRVLAVYLVITTLTMLMAFTLGVLFAILIG